MTKLRNEHRGTDQSFAQLERELRINEDRWRAVLDNPFMGISVLDENQHFIMANSTYQAMVGYANEELKKLTPLDITPANEREANRTLFRELQEGKRDHFELVKRLQRKDGELIWVQLYVFRTPDREGVGDHTFAMVFDITEKMQAQNALQVAHAELARSANVSRMGAMTASIAHEISQPLGAIVTFANAGLRWLKRTPPNLDEARQIFERIVHDGQRAADVIRSIRAMFKAKELERVSIDLNLLIHEVLALMHGQLQRRSITVHSELDAMLTPVMASRVQLQQVLFNLITNAIEAMEPVTERRRVLVVKSSAESPDQVHVWVEDTGSGIVPADTERIFSSFFTTKEDGMGIGLSICRSIIEAHGGRLWASPGHPHGAVFRFSLPAQHGADALKAVPLVWS